MFYSAIADACYEQGKFAQAVEAYDKALAIEPKNALIWFDKANALSALQKFDAAEHAYKQAILYNPTYVEAYNNLGIMFQGQGHFAKAEEAYKRAIEVCEGYINTYCNYGVLLKELRRFEEAEAMYKTVLLLEPSDFETLCNLALLKLAQGNFDEGWLLYESRYSSYKKVKVVEKPKLPLPQWRGEDISGKTILALPEQGYGDEIQFVRFVVALKEMGAKVVLQCRKELKELFTSLNGVDLLIVDGSDAKDVICDFWVFLMSIPGLLHAQEHDFARNVPYLFVPIDKKEEWAQKMDGDAFKVGLIYKGNPTHTNDRNRSIYDVELLYPLLDITGVTFFSLQKEYEADNGPILPAVSLGADIIDFCDTAAIIANLDLLICVDTAAAHVAGAMGKKCWVLLPYTGMDWRWALYEEHTPWYPSLRLFKQAYNETWEGVLGRASSALQLELGVG